MLLPKMLLSHDRELMMVHTRAVQIRIEFNRIRYPIDQKDVSDFAVISVADGPMAAGHFQPASSGKLRVPDHRCQAGHSVCMN